MRMQDGGRWRQLTAEVGERRFAGAFRLSGRTLEVVGGGGAREVELASGEAPAEVAARVLVEIQAAANPAVSAREAPIRARVEKDPDNRIGLALLALWIGLGVALVQAPQLAPLTFAFVLAGWILAVMAHEFGHAGVAYLAGDHTVRAKGYLSFDPRRYGDVTTSLVVPVIALALGGIGFPGGAVYLRTDLMRSPLWRAAASLAGPGATLVVLLLLAYVLRLWGQVATPGPLFNAVALLAFLQGTALVLNLLPAPGLDGFNAIRPFLPARWTPAIRKFEGLAIVGLLVLLLTVPGAGALIFGLGAAIVMGVGVPGEALQAGWQAFHFWR